MWQQAVGAPGRRPAPAAPVLPLPPAAGRAGGLQGRRWLVLACESKLVLHDLASTESRDISRSAVLESKAPTCLAFLLMNMPQVRHRAGPQSALTCCSA